MAFAIYFKIRSGAFQMNVSEALKAAIESSGETHYRIAKDAGVDWGTLRRFMDGTRPNIRIDTVDKLARHLGLELRPRSRRSG
jgi:hypothetical protein